mmetsp:Transcript_36249/g.102096  ORF Transcript_36249/g.102096 Transcript_36249/m.102096 type:complete len:429 (+) Transcript_36249:63-1349(+)
MIYLFSCLGDIFSLPAKLCAECGRLCNEINCKPCTDCCDQCGVLCSSWFHRPLGAYVLMAVLLGGAETAFCMWALLEGKDIFAGCKLPPDSFGEQVGMINWLYVQLGLAGLNVVFAPYIQYQLGQKLDEEATEQDPNSPLVEVSQAKVKEAFKDVFLHDIGVCLYFFALVFSFVWSFMGANWAQYNHGCDPEGHAGTAANFGTFFCIFVLLYTMLWYCFMECSSSMYVAPAYQAASYMMNQQAAQRRRNRGHEGAVNYDRGETVHAGNRAAGGMVYAGADNGHHGRAMYPSNDNSGAYCTPAYSNDVSNGHAERGQPPMTYTNAETGLERALRPQQILKLLACLGLDLFGNASYLLPGLGEGADLAYAPVQAVALKMLFQSNFVAVFGFIEEILPFTDIIPTATIAWVLETFFTEHPFVRALGINYYD